MQEDQKILTAGSLWGDFALSRYNSDGSIAWEKTTDMICRCGNGEIQNIAIFKH